MPLADRAEREQAIDTTRSFLVQAPAGSGKTELLTTRFLALLAEVEEPEDVLAITFTKAATAEMRYRILKKLEAANRPEAGSAMSGPEDPSSALANAALANSNCRGWRLLEQPQRLNIQTIDALGLRIAQQMPLRAKLAGTLQPTENAAPFYRRAARKTFDRLGGSDADLNEALQSLLALRDNNLNECERLIGGMLGNRDQWLQAFPLEGSIDWQQVRSQMEAPFRREVERVLGEAHALFSNHPVIVSELLELANYACNSEDLVVDILSLAGLNKLPLVTSHGEWRCITNLLFKKSTDDWLIAADKRHGFPAGKGKTSFETRQKNRRKKLIADLQQIDGLFDLLCAIRKLPAPAYTDEQWQTLRHIFTALRHAVVELNAVFTEQGAVDYVEIGIAARRVLDAKSEESNANPRIKHLLVDEFQDTSRRQHQLIASLLRDWTAGDGRTVFLVGDPMQSIYMFRQAEVELFEIVRQQGLETPTGNLPLENLQLTTNFRSVAGIVDPLNQLFAKVFPHNARPESASVDYLHGTARDSATPDGAYNVHPSFPEPAADDSMDAAAAARRKAKSRLDETAAMLEIIRRHLPSVEQARRENKEFTIAVLGRAKESLVRIAAAVRDAGIAFRAIELEGLSERQEIRDLQSLTRALLHPRDRIAWLSLLRAPWCGLPLRDLHLLCGTDPQGSGQASVESQIERNLHLLNEEPRQRVVRGTAILRAALHRRHSHMSLSSWIERTWHSLGGPACVDAAGYENALAYFRMLERVAPDGIAATGESMNDQLNRLFASPDPAAGDRVGVQLMTIHKAKGLGFNVVLVPGLDRKGATDSQALVRYVERTTGQGPELLAAPISEKGETSSLYKWIQSQKTARDAEERKRLLYVACTRAREELHLFGTAKLTQSQNDGSPVVKCESTSLLGTAWPALEEVFVAAHKQMKSEEIAAPKENVLSFTRAAATSYSGVFGLAAGAESGFRRLPAEWQPETSLANVAVDAPAPAETRDITDDRENRPEASRSARALGTVVHALLERAAHLLQNGASARELHAELPRFRRHASQLARHEGLAPAEVDDCASRAVSALESAIDHQHGLWILGPHPQADAEMSWSGNENKSTRTQRIDRSFRAGADPLSAGNDTLWIVDYKTATYDGPNLQEFFADQRRRYTKQLEDYGTILRLAHGSDLKIRLGLYYPLMRKLDFWPG